MILINVNKNELKSLHLDYMYQKVKKGILAENGKYKYDSMYLEYKKLLDYLLSNLEIVLIGELEELKELIDHIEKNIYKSDVKLRRFIVKRKEEKASVRNNKLRTFIKNYDLENVLLTVRRDEYNNIIEFEQDIHSIINNRILTLNNGEKVSFEKALNEVFNYKLFSEFKTERKNTWDAYSYTELLNIDVCPYCDRQFVQTFIKKEKKMRAVLDHFYSKSIYPYLAVSIFNLIPCCHQCNSSFKLNEDLYNDEIIYPFEEEFKNNVEFRIKSKDYNALIGLNSDIDIQIEILTTDFALKKKIERTIKVFALYEVYSGHKMYVKSLMRNLYINNSSRIQELYLQESAKFNSILEIENLIFLGMNDEMNIGKHVLSKLTYDIIKQYKQ